MISLLLFVYFIQIHSILTVHTNQHLPKDKTFSSTNCSMVDNDEDGITTPQFKIPFNPIGKNLKHCGVMYDNGSVYHLKISHQKFIPSTIFGLKYLEILEIKNSCFASYGCSHIPLNISCLRASLTELTIKNMIITSIPQGIGQLTKLSKFTISETNLRSLPDSIGDLSLLKFLYLSNNKLESLPRSIRNLKALEEITLFNNPNLHSVEPLNGLPSLRLLDAKNCRIKVLPHNLPQLIDLYMTNNLLTKLYHTKTLGYGTTDAKSFYLAGNRIQVISTQIQQVKNLSRLHLNNNQLINLPSNIFKIPTLSYVNIKNNNISSRAAKIIASKLRERNRNITVRY